LADLLRRHQSSGLTQYADLDVSDSVDSLIIIDRSVDWITPMCTQLTYEGMIDEFIGIKNCKPRLIPRCTTDILANVEIDPALLDPAQAPSASMPTAPKKRKHHLTASKDMLFGDIRDLNFAVVGTRLSKLARRLEGDYGGAKNLKSVSQMKEFVGKLGGLQSEQQNLRLRELTTFQRRQD
jgi:hypothetical protein